MALLSEQELNRVAQTIAEVEQQTDAELVTVLAASADNYLYIPTLLAALLGLLVPVVLTFLPMWLDAWNILTIQWLVFIVAAIAFRLPWLLPYLIPKNVKQWRAANLARRQFLEQNLHHTANETGVLIFVSEAERYVEIIADRGISQKVSNEQWQQIVDEFTQKIKKGKTAEGFVACIQRCGELLQTHCPATKTKDELPNHLILI